VTQKDHPLEEKRRTFAQVLESRRTVTQKDQGQEQKRTFAQVLESRRTMTQGDQGQEQRKTFSEVLESQRTMIQRNLSKGEGLSSRDQVQRRKV
jgi:hypothetical protein